MKTTFAVPGARTSASPASGAALDDLHEPLRRARLRGRRAGPTRPRAASASDGLTTTALPAATAKAAWLNGIPNGKFHGEITPITPSGS